MSLKQNDQYNEMIKEHQDEVLTALDNEIETIDKAVKVLLDKRDIITDCKAKFMTQILMSQTKWKIEEQN